MPALAADSHLLALTYWPLVPVLLMESSISTASNDGHGRTGRSAANNARQAIKRQVSSSPEPDSPPRRSRTTQKPPVKRTRSLSQDTFKSDLSSEIEFVEPTTPAKAVAPSPHRPTLVGKERERILGDITGELVWVRVDGDGEPADGDVIEHYWWPAEVCSRLACSYVKD